MKYKDFDTFFINVVARDMIDGKTVVRYIDDKDITQKITISKIDYDILPNQKLLVSMIDGDVIGYCKNKKDISNHTLVLQNDILNYSKKAQYSKFIISDENDIKKLNKSKIMSMIPMIIFLFAVLGCILSFWIESSGLKALFIFILTFMGVLSFMLSTVPSFSGDDTVNRQYEEIYTQFILDFEQSLADNKHGF